MIGRPRCDGGEPAATGRDDTHRSHPGARARRPDPVPGPGLHRILVGRTGLRGRRRPVRRLTAPPPPAGRDRRPGFDPGGHALDPPVDPPPLLALGAPRAAAGPPPLARGPIGRGARRNPAVVARLPGASRSRIRVVDRERVHGRADVRPDDLDAGLRPEHGADPARDCRVRVPADPGLPRGGRGGGRPDGDQAPPARPVRAGAGAGRNHPLRAAGSGRRGRHAGGRVGTRVGGGAGGVPAVRGRHDASVVPRLPVGDRLAPPPPQLPAPGGSRPDRVRPPVPPGRHRGRRLDWVLVGPPGAVGLAG